MHLNVAWAQAVKVSPTSDWLQPFSTAVIVVTSFSDLPGNMEDDARLIHADRAMSCPILSRSAQNAEASIAAAFRD